MCYRYCYNLFREMRKESEFWRQCCRNSTKVWKRKRKSTGEKILNFGNVIIEIPAVRTREKKIVAIVAMPLSKMGGKKNSGCQNRGRN